MCNSYGGIVKRILNFFVTFVTLAASFSFSSLIAGLNDIVPHPTIGNSSAKIQVVALLEPKCPDSKRYNNDSFPKLKKDFIDTNKVTYTVITTSFLNQSMPAAESLLCVYHQDQTKPNADLFFKYLNYIYKVQPPERENWATTDTLLKYAASASSEIDLKKLKSCIEAKHYKDQIVKNTAYGNKLMGELHTPTIFVNGMQIENKDDTIDYENLKNAINKALNESR